jgi:SET domain-containing protein
LTLYETRPSAIEGNGCFATQFIAAGTEVERFEGEEVALADLHRIEAQGKYHSSLAIGEGRHLLINVIDPREAEQPLDVGSGVGGFNHSCDSNLWMLDEVTVIARRDIAAGEELTLDDALASDDPSFRLGPCRCGTPACRGTITGADWRLPEVQARYEGHFSPFLNERISRLSAPSPREERGSGGEDA